MYIHSRSDSIADDGISLNILLLVTAAATEEQIKFAVMSGERPDLSAINGPVPQVILIKNCIDHCWQHLPDRRPTFAGIQTYFPYSFVRKYADPYDFTKLKMHNWKMRDESLLTNYPHFLQSSFSSSLKLHICW